MKKTKEIEYINQKEAEVYIEEKDDFLGFPARFFSFRPSTTEDYPSSLGWEDVVYYTERHKNPISQKFSIDKQFIYALSNPTIPGLLKIGYTAGNPLDRAKELGVPSGVAGEFVLEYVFPCYNAMSLEREIHVYLSSYRVKKSKEFFKIDLGSVKEAINLLGSRYNEEISERIKP